jgi:hypothetical protein
MFHSITESAQNVETPDLGLTAWAKLFRAYGGWTVIVHVSSAYS